eukprot:scaffold1973_cov399-Prasinococcus_capsulatus_cf.AAC.19
MPEGILLPEGFESLPIGRVGGAGSSSDREYWLLQLPNWLDPAELNGIKVKIPTPAGTSTKEGDHFDDTDETAGAKLKLPDGTRIHLLEQPGATSHMKLVMGELDESAAQVHPITRRFSLVPKAAVTSHRRRTRPSREPVDKDQPAALAEPKQEDETPQKTSKKERKRRKSAGESPAAEGAETPLEKKRPKKKAS